MQRRFKLGSRIVSTEKTPTLKFSRDGSQLILTFSVITTETPSADEEPEEIANSKRHTHRDLVEISGGSIFSSGLKASLTSEGADSATVLSLSMKVNSKVPGTGTALGRIITRSNGNGRHL